MTYDLSTGWTIALVIGVVWELLWKGAALWRAARLSQPIWFVLLLVISSVGVLPIIYLLSHPTRNQGLVAGKGAV